MHFVLLSLAAQAALCELIWSTASIIPLILIATGSPTNHDEEALSAGNMELVKLLVKRKADVASKNKSGKTAADLARDPAVKEVLSEAALAASKLQTDAIQSDTSGAEPSAPPDTANVQECGDASAQGDAEIGPQERPHDVMQDDGAATVLADNSKQPTVEHKSADRSKKSSRQGHSQTSDAETSRPSKMKKVALSFAEDEDADDV